MAALKRENLVSIDTSCMDLKESIIRIDAKIDNFIKQTDELGKKIEKIDARLWQIIVLLLAYPLGLIVGKLCHVF